MPRIRAIGFLSLILMGTMAIAAEPNVDSTDTFGKAVHAYFAGDLEGSLKMLNEAIAEKDSDPRYYFFRGVVKHSMGEEDAAQTEFARGAAMEAGEPTRDFAINEALQRVQGSVRVEIETARQNARQEAAAKREAQKKARYEAMTRKEAEVLLDPNRPAVKAEVPLPELTVSVDPFASGLMIMGGEIVKVVKKEATTPPAGTETKVDPFANPMDKPKDDPFGGQAKPPATDNPFGGPAKTPPKADDNPFGNPAPKGNPFEDPPKTGDDKQSDNPFGNPPKGS